MIVNVGQNPSAGWIVREVIKHPVYLVKFPLGIPVLDAKLVAVSLSDGAGLVRPGIPDVAVQVRDPVGLLLPDPEHLIDGTPERTFPNRDDRELFSEIVAIYDAELFDGMGRRSVVPPGYGPPGPYPECRLLRYLYRCR